MIGGAAGGRVPRVGILDRVRRFCREWKEGLAEQAKKAQLEAFEESKPTDEFVTMRIMGHRYLETLAREGWDLVTKVNDTEHEFPAEYIVRIRRADLARALGREAG